MFTKLLSSKIGAPLAITAGFGVALAIGASAVAISPAAAAAIAPLVTAVSCSASSACVSGTNKGSGPGVSGTSAKGIGVNGLSTSSYGLFGTSSSGVGVKAVSKSSSAIFATNDASSYSTINAQQTGNGNALAANAKGSGAGVYATAATGNGVYGYSTDRNAGFFENDNDSYYALFALSDTSDGYMIGAYNNSTGNTFYVDADAGVYGTSFTTTNAIRSNHKTVDGHRVTSYGAESSTATLEDFGSARLTNGVAVVPLEHTFRQTIDARSGYSVFLTAGGDNRGLYVVKSPGSFTIHEAQGGRSTLAFDYRIVAHPADAVATRLPAAAPERRPFASLGRVR